MKTLVTKVQLISEEIYGLLNNLRAFRSFFGRIEETIHYSFKIITNSFNKLWSPQSSQKRNEMHSGY